MLASSSVDVDSLMGTIDNKLGRLTHFYVAWNSVWRSQMMIDAHLKEIIATYLALISAVPHVQIVSHIHHLNVSFIIGAASTTRR